jgi:hypothetical protein
MKGDCQVKTRILQNLGPVGRKKGALNSGTVCEIHPKKINSVT